MSDRVCVNEDCDRPMLARGMCMYHYNRWRRPDPVIPDEKACTRCGEVKPATAFHVSKRGLRSWCRECVQTDNRERMRIRRYGVSDFGLTNQQCISCGKDFLPWRRDQLHCSNRRCHSWTVQLRLKFGITPDQYRALLQNQQGVCAICGAVPNGKRLAVDHDHATGAVRALLCQRCNLCLGQVEDDPALMRRMIRYINQHSKNTRTATSSSGSGTS